MDAVNFRAAVMRKTCAPLTLETVSATPSGPNDVLVKVGAASICHTDLEVLDGQLRYPLPMVLGHEVAGTVEAVGPAVTSLQIGDRVALHWNPHCGHCFYCDNGQPILCEPFSSTRAKGQQLDGAMRHSLDADPLHILMHLGGFAEYCVVAEQSAVKIPDAMPLDAASLLGCGVMTGVGAATRVAGVTLGSSVAVLGCGAVGLSAIQGARLAGAQRIIAIDPDVAKLERATAVGATDAFAPGRDDVVAEAKACSRGRGVDFVIEAAGSAAAFQTSLEVCRPGGKVVWLGKVDVNDDVSFRWGTLMGERQIVRSSYGGTRPQEDFPMLAQAYLSGQLQLDDMITGRVTLDEINDGFDALRAGRAIRTVVVF